MSESSVKEESSMPESESLGLLISGADELRKALPMNESGFNFMSRAHNLRGRDHYMYAVLDELEKVAMALTLSQDWFDERPTDPATDDVGQRLLRNTFALVEREQALHIRRLTEILVDLINFSKTNSKVHYDHYLLHKELAEHQVRKKDFDRYFNCENLNTLSSIDLTKRSIAEAEKKFATC